MSLLRPARRPLRKVAVTAALVTALPLTVAPMWSAAAAAPAWHAKTPPLTTPWTSKVSPTNALPAYPRPQMTRSQWQNLNGVWQFGTAAPGSKPPVHQGLPERILVPYPVESALSGIMRHETSMWYRRTFAVPASWHVGTKQHLLLHFGAIDYTSQIWVNGRKVATHTGGYDAFTVDVTKALRGKGSQELIVGAQDPTDTGWQPLGKQRTTGGGIFYTPSSGIWQTVWMEPTAGAHIDRLDTTPDLAKSRLAVRTVTVNAPKRLTVRAVAYIGKKVVGVGTGHPGQTVYVPVRKPRLWSPTTPFLYTLKVSLLDRKKVVDHVGSYFGMRSISVGKAADGKQRILLNGTFVMQAGPLDQGFWPDGIYTAPTDAALKFDLAQEKSLGFNMVRKHIKVEPDRWYYWADKLGLLVWQDMPAMKIDFSADAAANTPPPAAQQEFVRELHRIVLLHQSFPSIITWVPFNEGWGEWESNATTAIAAQIKSWDPSRLVNRESGVNCCFSQPDTGGGDLVDDHTYVGPGSPVQRDNRATVDGEYGGLGLHTPGHELRPGNSFAYELEPDSATLTSRFVGLQQKLIAEENRCGLSAGVYTQTTDVEDEINGFFTYDRQVLKMDRAAVTAANKAVVSSSALIGTQPPVVYPPGKPGIEGTDAYAFDEGTGVVAHDSQRGHDAALQNGATWVAGRTGTAVHLNGTNQYVDTGASLIDVTGSYSVSAWVKLDRTDAYATAVSQDSPTDANSAFFLQYNLGAKAFSFSFPSGQAHSLTSPVAGQWYHLVGVRDAAAGTYTLFLDGQQQQTGYQCLADPATGHTQIGRAQFGHNPVDFFPGSIDGVHVYDRALSAAEVASLYATGR